MKFSSRFTKGDRIWFDRASGYYDLVHSSRSGVDHLNSVLKLHDGNFLVGVTMVNTPVYESNFSVELKGGKNVYHVGHLLGEIGCSAWCHESYGGTGCHRERIAGASEEEGLYYARKAYLRRLEHVIKSRRKRMKDVDNLLPSELEGLKSDVLKLEDLKASLLEQVKNKPTISLKKILRRESKWNIGDVVWTTDTSDHVFGTCGNGDGDWKSCADRYSADDLEIFDTIYRILTDKPKKLLIGEIRTWDCEGPDFLYKGVSQSHEYHEKFCFATEAEAAAFFEKSLFMNRKETTRKAVLEKYIGIMDTILAGEMTPKNRRILETHREKFNKLK